MYPAVPDRHLPSVTPLTARSVALSTLLGYHPPALPVSASGEGRGAVRDRGPRHPGCPDAHGEGRRRDRGRWRVPPVRAIAATSGRTGCAHLAAHPAVDWELGDGRRHEHDPAVGRAGGAAQEHGAAPDGRVARGGVDAAGQSLSRARRRHRRPVSVFCQSPLGLVEPGGIALGLAGMGGRGGPIAVGASTRQRVWPKGSWLSRR